MLRTDGLIGVYLQAFSDLKDCENPTQTFSAILTNGAGGWFGGRGRSRTHQARSRASTALKAAHPTGSDTLPPSSYVASGRAASGFVRD